MKDDPRPSPSGSGGSSGADDPILQTLASAPSLRPPLRIGQRLGGRYLIEAYLGRGGMGEVYRALDETLGERVALKLVHGSRDEAELRNEVRLAQKATHANVCRIFDLEDVDGRQLLKMEFVAGETLAARLLREGKLPIVESVRIAREIALGLMAAHASGIVHFDLKPGNVMLDGKRVVLMDFGLARLASTSSDKLRGTPGYIAPELLRYQPADHRADLYALGCVLFEMLCGGPVFGNNPRDQIAVKHASEAAPALRTQRKDAPAWVDKAVALLLAKAPGDREAGLKILLAGPRSPWLIASPLLAITALLLAAGIWRLVNGSTWVAQIYDYPVFDENIGEPWYSPDGKWFVFDSTRAGSSMQLYVTNRRTGATTKLDTPPDANGPAWTRDGKHLLYTDGGYTLQRFVRRQIGGDPPALIGEPEPIAHAFFGDDCGDAIAYVDAPASGWRLMLRSADGSAKSLYVAEPKQMLFMAICSPDGQRIAIVVTPSFEGAGDIFLVDRAGQAEQLTHDHVTMPALSWTPEGKTLIAAQKVGGKVQLFELELAGGARRRLTFDAGPDNRSTVSPDGRELLYTRDTTVWMPYVGKPGDEHSVAAPLANHAFPRALSDDTAVVQRDTDGDPEVIVLRLSDGETLARLGPGRMPFASFDRSTIYFIDAKRENVLDAITVGGGPVSAVATLPGNISYGNAGEDGIHLLLTVARKQLGYFVPPAGEPRQEVEGGLVSVAPKSGWRAVTNFVSREDRKVELQLVPPGASLDKPSRKLTVVSFHNVWLDDHRLGYCGGSSCSVLDVKTGLSTEIKTDSWIHFQSTVMPDGARILSLRQNAHVTLHSITNFADR